MDATLTLNRVFISPVNDLSAYVKSGSAGSIGGGGSRTDTLALNGSFRQYANGVTRLLTSTVRSHTHSLALRALTSAEVAQVKGMVGQTCLFRDSYGRRFFGSFLIVDSVNIPNSAGLADLALVIQETTTYSEAV